MALPGFNSPAAGFEQPFELLGACHERVQRTLGLLARLRRHLLEHGCDEQARQAARDVLRYFDIAAPLHHEDEELHVFPPLLARANAGVRALVRELQDEHRQMEQRWQTARAVLLGVAHCEPAAWQAHTPAQQTALDDFAGLYNDHIAKEEQVAYPAALAHLTPGALQAMSADMMRRRGATPPAPA